MIWLHHFRCKCKGFLFIYSWIALPDAQAGTDFYTVSYAPATYGTQFSVLNIQDEPVSVTLTYTGRATPALQGTQFVLQPGEVRQIQVSQWVYWSCNLIEISTFGQRT